jgi:hypothetical protein
MKLAARLAGKVSSSSFGNRRRLRKSPPRILRKIE